MGAQMGAVFLRAMRPGFHTYFSSAWLVQVTLLRCSQLQRWTCRCHVWVAPGRELDMVDASDSGAFKKMYNAADSARETSTFKASRYGSAGRLFRIHVASAASNTRAASSSCILAYKVACSMTTGICAASACKTSPLLRSC